MNHNPQKLVQSPLRCSDWCGDLTHFSGFFDVFPASTLECSDWEQITNFISGKLSIGPDKKVLPYVIPCLLKDAPFTLKTSKKAIRLGLGITGKQRSSAHVTEAKWLLMDIDGMNEEKFSSKLQALLDTGCAFCIYTTHSHGRSDKPGVRARLAIPLDKAISAPEYEAVWLGLDMLFFEGEIAKADRSGCHLWQQQGVYAAAAERSHSAFSHSQKGSVWSTDTLIAAAPTKKRHRVSTQQRTNLNPGQYVDRLLEALPWIDAEDTSTWHKAITAFKASAPLLGEDNARELAIRYSNLGSKEARKLNEADRRYNPSDFFDNVAATMPPDVAIGVLLGLAKDNAICTVVEDRGKTNWTVSGHKAAVYLCRNHLRIFTQLTDERTL